MRLFPSLSAYYEMHPPLDLYQAQRIFEMFKDKKSYAAFLNELAINVSSKTKEYILLTIMTGIFLWFQVIEYLAGRWPSELHNLVVQLVFLLANYVILLMATSAFSGYLGFVRGISKLSKYRDSLAVYSYSVYGLLGALESGEKIFYTVEEMQDIISSTLSFHDLRSRLELISEGIDAIVFPISIVVMSLAAIINYFEIINFGRITSFGIGITIILLGFVATLFLAPQVTSLRLISSLHKDLLAELRRLLHASERSYAYFLRNPVEITTTAAWKTLKDVENTIETLEKIILLEERQNPMKASFRGLLKILVGVVLPVLTSVGSQVVKIAWEVLF